MQAKDNEVALDGGMKYKAIIVQDRTYISPDAESKLNQLRSDGVPVIRCDKGEDVDAELRKYGILPDLQADKNLHFFHRKASDHDIYFVYNHSDSAYEGRVRLRDAERNMELWNPQEVTKRNIQVEDGEMNLRLNPWEAWFLVSDPR